MRGKNNLKFVVHPQSTTTLSSVALDIMVGLFDKSTFFKWTWGLGNLLFNILKTYDKKVSIVFIMKANS